MGRVYLKNDKLRVGVSKILKLKFKGVYTVVAILEATNGEETTEIYQNKPDGRGRTKTVNASKLKKGGYAGVRLSWEEDPEFAVEVTVENDGDYQPNYYFRKKVA